MSMLHPYVSTSDNSQNMPLWFPLLNMSLPAKKFAKKKLESRPVHTVRNHIPVFTCINRSLTVFRFSLFSQLLKHGFCCLHIFKKSSFMHTNGMVFFTCSPASKYHRNTKDQGARRPLVLCFGENQPCT